MSWAPLLAHANKKPVWLNEQSSIMDKNGTLVQARGIQVCKNPIGEELYVRTYLVKKFDDIRSVIKRSLELPRKFPGISLLIPIALRLLALDEFYGFRPLSSA